MQVKVAVPVPVDASLTAHGKVPEPPPGKLMNWQISDYAGVLKSLLTQAYGLLDTIAHDNAPAKAKQ